MAHAIGYHALCLGFDLFPFFLPLPPPPPSLVHTVGPFHSFSPSHLYSDGALQYERPHYASLMLQLLLRIHINCSLIPYPSTGGQQQVRAFLPIDGAGVLFQVIRVLTILLAES